MVTTHYRQAACPRPATQLQPGTSFTLEMPPGARTWQLGRLQPRLALQYYYDWGHMMGTGAIYDRLPRASNNPPTAWEQMALQLIPPPTRTHEPVRNPAFPGDNQTQSPGPGAAPSAMPTPSPMRPTPAPAAAPAQQTAGDLEEGDDDGDDDSSFMQRATQLDPHEAASSQDRGGTQQQRADRRRC